MKTWMRRKPMDLESVAPEHRLQRTLSWWHLIALGVGAIVGTGIYTLIGVGAGLAGPGVILSFAIAGVICACTALAYAEVATMIPASGSSYTYSYVVLGEIIAWVVGWSLILEYSLVVSAVAVGWSGYAVGFLHSLGVDLPVALTAGPHAGGLINLPAIVITGLVTWMMVVGMRESATFNAILVVIKIIALGIFAAVALPHFDAANFHPFMPYGFAGHQIDGVQHGVMAAAAIIFFAFYGFDAISTAAEEAKKPERDLPIGIIGSMLACTAIYIVVAAAAVGAMPFGVFSKSPEPLAMIVRELGSPQLAAIVAAAAVVALPTVLLGFLYGQTRIFFVMARDGFLPMSLAKVNPKTGTPARITVVTGVLVAILAGLVPLAEIAALANAGTLLAFIAVSVCLLVLRKTAPDQRRVYRTPLAWVVAPVAIAGCIYLFFSLPEKTRLFFCAWNAVGLVWYVTQHAYREGKARKAGA
jgi:APA family basic amino acid/polyamine antiporter